MKKIVYYDYLQLDMIFSLVARLVHNLKACYGGVASVCLELVDRWTLCNLIVSEKLASSKSCQKKDEKS